MLALTHNSLQKPLSVVPNGSLMTAALAYVTTVTSQQRHIALHAFSVQNEVAALISCYVIASLIGGATSSVLACASAVFVQNLIVCCTSTSTDYGALC